MDIIKQSQAGNPTAFAELFEKYKNLVYRTALLMLDDRDEADDALQEVFIQVHRSLASYQPEKGAFTTWLHRITVNHCLNRRRSRPGIWVPLEQVSRWLTSSKQQPVEDRVGDEDEIRAVLRKLSPKLRTVLVLRFYWDLSYAEIAEVLQVPVGTVQSRLSQALNQVRCDLGESRNLTSVPGREEIKE